MTTQDVPPCSFGNALEVIKETMLSDIHDIIEEINTTPDFIFARMGVTKDDMRAKAMKTLKAIEELK